MSKAVSPLFRRTDNDTRTPRVFTCCLVGKQFALLCVCRGDGKHDDEEREREVGEVEWSEQRKPGSRLGDM